jgi:hypothetical protein
MCYTVPTAAAMVATFMWRKNRSPKTFWLMLMFYGGSLFGIIDHLWNGELFLVSKYWIKDLSLGAVITVAIFVTWGILLGLAKNSRSFNPYLAIAEGKRVKW